MIRKTTGYYDLNEQEEYKLRFVSSVTLMDDDGNIIEQKKYSEEGEFIEQHSFLYSENGDVLTSRSEYLLNGNEDSLENIYDDKGQLIVSIKSFFDGETQYERHKYSWEGNRIESAVYREDEELLWRIEYKYDELRNLIEETEYDENGLVLAKVLNEYKEKQIIKESIYVEEILHNSVHYELNEEKVVVAITTINSEGEVTDKSVYIKKEIGSVVLFQIDGNELSEDSFLRKSIYNENDLLIFSSYINESALEENEFEYDLSERLTKEFYKYKDAQGMQKSLIKHVYEQV